MSDELRQNAERLAKWFECTCYQVVGLETVHAVAKIADAYLAEHPADDDEPIEFDWVATLGCDDSGTAILYWEDDTGRPVEFSYPSGWYVYGSRIHNQPQTRGDVRRLLAALGIEVAK